MYCVRDMGAGCVQNPGKLGLQTSSVVPPRPAASWLQERGMGEIVWTAWPGEEGPHTLKLAPSCSWGHGPGCSSKTNACFHTGSWQAPGKEAQDHGQHPGSGPGRS